MRCPYCGANKDRVVDSREIKNGTEVRRRRQCLVCGRRFTTYERIELIPVMVIKKDGSRQPFSRDKIINGLLKACEKRPVSAEELEAIADELETLAQSKGEISSKEIGEVIMERLKSLDQVAYVRFASVYKEFRDLEEFYRELEVLKGGSSNEGED